MNVRAYYNEIDGYAAQWLRNLIDAGLIAPGDVDTRSIVDVRASDLAGYTQCHFFAGLGGWSGALRLAGIADSEPLWTGSCPCQPFSLAGKQKGFDDERHLWPVWRELIRDRKPANVFGEQVASATDWLGLVRSDLEAMGYAVGCMPVQAASAGADHLRDRFWFVGDHQSQRRREGRTEHEVRERHRATVAKPSRTIDMADTHSERRPGPRALGESIDSAPRRNGKTDQPLDAGAGAGNWPDGVADAFESCEGEGRQQRSGQQRGPRGDQEACDSRETMADTHSEGRNGARQSSEAVSESDAVQRSGGRSAGDYEWVIGADGKARRVKPGIRLLAHGVPARVAKLRALGNAIDLRPAAQFIIASTQAMNEAAE